MACHCGAKWIFVGVCIAQLVSVAIRLAFDCMGMLWTPIIANFCQIIGVVFGIAGALRYKYRIVAVYSTWTLIWIGWNIYVICYYLEIGSLNMFHHGVSMNLYLSNSSSWFISGTAIICDPVMLEMKETYGDVMEMSTQTTTSSPCIIDFRNVEIGMSIAQIVFACIGFILSCYVIGIIDDDDDIDEYDYLAASVSEKKVHNNADNTHSYGGRQPLVREQPPGV